MKLKLKKLLYGNPDSTRHFQNLEKSISYPKNTIKIAEFAIKTIGI